MHLVALARKNELPVGHPLPASFANPEELASP
jgi:hypothetical protein